MAELEDALAKRAELGLGFEGCAAPGCLLPLGRDGGMAAVLIAWTGSTAPLSNRVLSATLMTHEVLPQKGEVVCHALQVSRGWG